MQVAVSHSRDVAKKLEAMGATYQYDEVPGAQHLYDMDPSVGMDEMYAFLAKHL